MDFLLSGTPIEPSELRQRLLNLEAGAYNSYEGWVRNHNEGKAVTELHYSGYQELGSNVASQILAEARSQFDILDAAVVHRVGPLRTGDIAIWVGVIAHHRGDTFLACRYIVDNIKHRLPIWKKEIYQDGTSKWIESNHCGVSDPKNLERDH